MPEVDADKDLMRRRLAAALGVESPFPWQLALLDRFLNNQLPRALDVPTGLGKTAVMAIWLIARAAGASLPRRLVYVVDRRAVVDQATKVAETLREQIEADTELKQALGLEGPLPISTLRGKFLDNREWLADPSLPAIVLGTVDMIGSRLLFEGYGVSRKMRSYHAGLLGADTLVVLDEAHLVPPFERLVEAIASGRDARDRTLLAEAGREKIVPSFHSMSLSATGRGRDDALVLSDADRAHPTVARRLKAVKRTHLLAPVNAKELPEKLAAEAWALSEAGTRAIRCIVFCNRRDDAKKVLQGIQGRLSKVAVEGVEVELFVGGRRLFEREEAAGWLDARGFFAGSNKRPQHATFVIATSAGEVGVDLDADHLVCDLVAWERMVQRLGRVNRRGDGEATVVVVEAIAEDARMKERLTAARALLHELPRLEGDTFDASPGALTALKARCAAEETLKRLLSQASTPPELHPPLARPTIESWSMTSLEEHAGRPEVEPWIRGWPEEEELPQTTVVWRKYLPVTDRGTLFGKADMEAFRDAANPHLAERLETETWRVVEWLDKRLKSLAPLEEAEQDLIASERPLRKTDIAAVILDGPLPPRTLRASDLSNKEKREDVQRALANGLLLVDARLGGLVVGLLDAESDEPVPDVTLIDGEPRLVPFRVRRIAEEDARDPQWRREARIPVRKDDDKELAWLLIESLIKEAAESEEGRSVGAPNREQRLEEHQSWAEEAAHQIAVRLALPEPYTHMLKLAARLHDEGKRAKRWQRAFKAPPDGVYAKTTSRPNLNLLENYRHELGSLPYAERDERVQTLETPLRELCLHLIAAHHGHARPLLRTDGAEEPQIRLVQRAQEIALRFTRLEKQWGPWGLAWWEALLRAADQQASRRNDLEVGERG